MRNDPRDNARRLYEVASTQGGYFTAAQALEAGYQYRQHHYHRESGNWIRMGRGIYRLRDYPPSEREDLIRLALWSRNRAGQTRAVVSHETALTIHNLSDVMPSTIHLTVPKRGFRKEPPAGVVLHRERLDGDEIETREGYLVTTPLRTVLDVAAASLSQEHLNRALEDTLDKGLIRRRQLAETKMLPEVQTRILEALATYDSRPGRECDLAR